MISGMRIICLTEETVETFYLLGRPDVIAGVSRYVERPPEAKRHPVVSQFIRSDIEKIVAFQPDLVVGFSDLQREIAAELIGRGLSVLVTNQRSLAEILDNILLLGRLIGEAEKARELVAGFSAKLAETRALADGLSRRPRVYFEEWDQPRYSGIRWVSELIEACGGQNIFAHKAGALARDREVTDAEVIELDPEIIFGCWCGKKVKLDSFAHRYPGVAAVRNNFLWELDPAVFLQPGPALFVDGLDQMLEKIKNVVTLTTPNPAP
jgi:iron complex transport system substrate-binding protein